jgi:hypothetical protein
LLQVEMYIRALIIFYGVFTRWGLLNATFPARLAAR